MVKLSGLFPGEWLAPHSKGSFSVKCLIESVEDGLIVYMYGVFEEYSAFLLFLLVLIVLFKLQSCQEALFEGFKQFDVHDEDSITALLLRLVIVDMHITQDVDGSWSKWLVDIEVHL